MSQISGAPCFIALLSSMGQEKRKNSKFYLSLKCIHHFLSQISKYAKIYIFGNADLTKLPECTLFLS